MDENKIERAEAIRESLTETFQEYMSDKEDVPSEELRERVFDTLSNFEFVLNIIDLYTVKLAKAKFRFLMDLNNRDSFDENE